MFTPVFTAIGMDVRPDVNPVTTPAGAPSTESVTVYANPLRLSTQTITLSARPCCRLMVAGVTDNAIAGSGPTGSSPLHDASARMREAIVRLACRRAIMVDLPKRRRHPPD